MKHRSTDFGAATLPTRDRSDLWARETGFDEFLHAPKKEMKPLVVGWLSITRDFTSGMTSGRMYGSL